MFLRMTSLKLLHKALGFITPNSSNMVTLVVATTTDPTSLNSANAHLSKPGWSPLPPPLHDTTTFANAAVRVLIHKKSIVDEDETRWRDATGEDVDELIFLSKHKASSSRPSLTMHPIGVPHLRDGDVLLQGGWAGHATLPNPRIGPWLRLLKKPAMFLEIGEFDELKC